MSTITSGYQIVPSSEISTTQTTRQILWRGWSLSLLKPQQEFFNGLGKLVGVQLIGFIVTALLSEISSQGDIARSLDLHLTNTYYTTCTQAQNAFMATMIPTGIYLLCTYAYFLKKNQEKCDAAVSPEMQVAIQHRIRDEVRAELERRIPS